MPSTDAPNAPAKDALSAPALAGFAAFGAFWGVWGAAIPRVQAHAQATDGQLGLALLFIGAGALPAMPAMGRAIDRWGLRTAAVPLAALGLSGLLVAATAGSVPLLCAELAVTGAAGGATDVAINALAGRAEAVSGRPVIGHAHGTFSALVVLASAATGALSTGSLVLPFALLAAGVVATAGHLFRAAPGAEGPRQSRGRGARPSRPGPLIALGALGAIALAVENVHQSWSAVFAHRELGASVGLAAVAPAVFAGTVALTRFGTGRWAFASRSGRVLVVGALVAAAGTATLAAAPVLAVAAVGLALAAAGTGVLFPTIVRVVSRTAPEPERGRATSLVASVSYLGFLFGPVYVGAWADGAGLRAAMLAVTGLAVVLAVAAPLALRDRAAAAVAG